MQRAAVGCCAHVFTVKQHPSESAEHCARESVREIISQHEAARTFHSMRGENALRGAEERSKRKEDES